MSYPVKIMTWCTEYSNQERAPKGDGLALYQKDLNP